MPDAEKALSALVRSHSNWAYRENTIIQAAIIMLSEASKEDVEKYLRKVHQKDGRYC